MSKILLVEDNPDAVKRIIRYINKIFAELDVVSFPEAGDALQYAKANDVSLFILDIQLEDYKGTSLAKQLRELPEYKYTPIIFETALAGEELSAYRDVKCYSFLVKPFGEEEFAAAFRDALGLSKQMNQAAGIGGGSCRRPPIPAQKPCKTVRICSPGGSRPHRSDRPAYPSRSAYRFFAGPPPYCRPDGA